MSKGKKERPLTSLSKDEFENLWDDVFIKEEGIILEFDMDTKTGKVKSLSEGRIYNINTRELVRTKLELKQGDKVLFAPFEDPDGNDYARVISIVELNVE